MLLTPFLPARAWAAYPFLSLPSALSKEVRQHHQGQKRFSCFRRKVFAQAVSL